MPEYAKRPLTGESGNESFPNDGSERTYENHSTIACKSVVKPSLPTRTRVRTKLVRSIALRPLRLKRGVEMTILEQEAMRAITRIPKKLEGIKEALSFLTVVTIALSGKGKTELDNDLEKAIKIIKNKG